MSLLSFLGITTGDAPPVGSPAPTPTGTAQDGSSVSFAEVYRSGLVLVYFYPKADTPGCTAQACSLRDAYADLQGEGLTVLGVSIDTPAAQTKFRTKHLIPFTLIADEDGAVAKAFGVPTLLGLAAKRQAFLIRDGNVVWSDLSAATKGQADDVRVALARLRGSPPPSA